MRTKHWMGMAVAAGLAMGSYSWAAPPQGLGSGYGYTHIARKGSAQVSKAELQDKVRRMIAPEAAPKKMAVRKNSTHKRMGKVAPDEKHGKAKKMGKLKFKKAKKGKKVKQAKSRSNKGGDVRGKDRADEVHQVNE